MHCEHMLTLKRSWPELLASLIERSAVTEGLRRAEVENDSDCLSRYKHVTFTILRRIHRDKPDASRIRSGIAQEMRNTSRDLRGY